MVFIVNVAVVRYQLSEVGINFDHRVICSLFLSTVCCSLTMLATIGQLLLAVEPRLSQDSILWVELNPDVSLQFYRRNFRDPTVTKFNLFQ